jgi:Ca-activated chloride channel homolog
MTHTAHVLRKPIFLPSGALTVQVPAQTEPTTYVQERDGTTYFVAEVPISNKRVQRVIAELEPYFKALNNAEVRLTRLRDRREPVQQFKIRNGNWDALRDALESTVYDGASALTDWVPEPDVGEYLFVSDGLMNYGSTRFPDLLPTQRLYALNASLVADTSRLSALAARNRGSLIQLLTDKVGVAAEVLLSDGSTVKSLRSDDASDLMIDSSDASHGILRIAGKLTGRSARVVLTMAQQSKTNRIVLPVSVDDNPEHPLAAHLWASYKLRQLAENPDLYSAEIRRIGIDFGIPTQETSLLVLERIEDYVRYGVKPPLDYTAAYQKLVDQRGMQTQQKKEKHIDDVVRQFKEKIVWWEKSYPKEKPAPKKESVDAAAGTPEMPQRSTQQPSSATANTPAPRINADQVVRAEVMGYRSAQNPMSLGRFPESTSGEEATNAPASISIKKWSSDAPYIARLKAASVDQVYAIYLDEKPSYVNSTGFYLDVADILFEKGQRELALRVLSNLAEMDLESRNVLRILGYRLLQAGAPEIALPIFEKVKKIAVEEPQSFRDLGLAFADAGKFQQAIDQLNEVVNRPWERRFAEIELIALAEMNAIIGNLSKAGATLDTSKIDPRLLKNMPLDLRVALTWDADNSDMDLWVTDPNGEKCFYSHRFTYQGGRMSRDFTGGYGPKEFSLREAMPGKYQIQVNFFGSRQQVVASATTLQVKLTTGFGTSDAKDQMITLRLKGRGETVFVGEFEVKAK